MSALRLSKYEAARLALALARGETSGVLTDERALAWGALWYGTETDEQLLFELCGERLEQAAESFRAEVSELATGDYRGTYIDGFAVVFSECEVRS